VQEEQQSIDTLLPAGRDVAFGHRESGFSVQVSDIHDANSTTRHRHNPDAQNPPVDREFSAEQASAWAAA